MRKLRRKLSSVPVAALVLLSLGSAATLAQRQFVGSATVAGRPEVRVVLAGTVKRDSANVAVEKARVLNRGEILEWTITSENSGSAAAYDYKAVGRIPAGMTFVPGSATADGSVNALYSIDQGKSYSAQPTIAKKQPDGSVKQVPAPVSMYTNIRYEWTHPFVEGGKLSASYKVRVN